MRHRKRRGKLSRPTAHRRATLRSLAKELFEHERITTTIPKAKAARPVVEKLITRAKKGGLANYRYIIGFLGDKAVAKKVMDNIAPRYATRAGGYTRLVRLPLRRLGDATQMAVLELVEGETSQEVAADAAETSKD